MAEVLFYHLEPWPLEKVLPILLEKSLERGWHAIIEAGSAERLEALDSALWTYRDDSFLPHALAGTPTDADTPILLTTQEGNPNSAQIRFFVDRAVPADPLDYERIAYLFSGHDPEALQNARDAWKRLKPGHSLTYWQQDTNGRWSKKG